MTQKIPLDHVVITDRQRYDLGDLEKLGESLKTYGQIQPIVLRQSDNRLVAGGRRCAAARLIGWTDIGYVYRESLSDSDLGILELEENIRRKQITWQENCLAVTKIHELKTRENALVGQQWGHRETAEMLDIKGHSNVFSAIKVARRLAKDPTKTDAAWKCDSFLDCIRLIIKEQEDDAVAQMAKATLKPALASYDEDESSTPNVVETNDAEKADFQAKYLSNPLNDPDAFEEYWAERQKLKTAPMVVPLSKMFHHGSCIPFMLDHPDTFAHVITDIPYAIDMENLQQENTGMDVSDVKDEHNVESNMDLMRKFFPAAFVTLKDSGFLVTWCDQEQWQFMYNLAIEAGFRVQRWPITWVKTSPCMNQMAKYNFTKNTEIAIVCRKPNAMLVETASVCAIVTGKDDLCSQIGHAFAKPYAVWDFIVSKVSRPGDLILEPFAGRGSGVVSMLRMGRRVMGCELQENHYNHLIENVKKHYLASLDNHVTFQ